MGVLARLAATITGLSLEAVAPTPPPPAGAGGWPLAPIVSPGRLEPFTVAHGLGSWGRDLAMSLPTIARARTLLTSQVARLPLDRFRTDGLGNVTGGPLEARPWQLQPEPDRPIGHTLAWTVDDLMFHGLAYWLTVERYAPDDGAWPRRFRRMPYDEVTVNRDGTVLWGADPVPARDVVVFCGLVPGLLTHGQRTVSIALELDAAAQRFAATEVPAGTLEADPTMEQMTPEQLDDASVRFAERRRTNVVAALQGFTYKESSMDPNRLQLVDGRQYQALELARLADIPPYLVGAPAGTGMTYLNAQQAVSDLVTFGASPHITCIEQTLSMPWVTPRGQVVRFRLPPDPTVLPGGDNAPGADRPADGMADDAGGD